MQVQVFKDNDGIVLQIENDTGDDIIVDRTVLRVDVSPHPDAEFTHTVHCEYLKNTIENQIRTIERLTTIHPENVFNLPISFGALKRNRYFKSKNHRFDITLYINEDEKHFFFGWTSGPAETSIENSDHKKDKDIKMGNILTYKGSEPFLMTDDKLTLHLAASAQNNRWVDLDSKPLRLNADVSIEILPDSGSESEADIIEGIHEAFETESDKIVVNHNVKDDSRLVSINIKNIKQSIPKDIRVRLKVRFTKTSDTRMRLPKFSNTSDTNDFIECIVPAMLKRPAFPGYASLDFGTTNSACVYFTPRGDRLPNFPDKKFSPIQEKALQETTDWLMTTLHEEELKDKKYAPLSKRFINFAREMWQETSGGRVRNFDEIRNYFHELSQSEDEKEIIKTYAKLIVYWGVKGYRDFCQKYDGLENLLAELYFTCLNRVMDIDIQEDCLIYLPELEKGSKDGIISSTIRMDELIEKKDGRGNTAIDPFNSHIKMGSTIEDSMRDSRTNHKVFVTGAKRWIGDSREKAYFYDMKNSVFRDTYDPICTLGIKHLISKVEQATDKNTTCLNDLVVTYPAELSQLRRERLEQIVRSLGIKKVDIRFDEATAAALYYMWRELSSDLFAGIDGFLARSRVREEFMKSPLTDEVEKTKFFFQNILLYDMGGGTTDIALLEVGVEELKILKEPKTGTEGRYFMIRPKILGLTGREDFGGDNVTLAVFRILKSKLATKVAEKLIDNDQTDRIAPEIQDVVRYLKEGSENDLTKWFSEKSIRPFEEYKEKWGEQSDISVKDAINILIPTDFGAEADTEGDISSHKAAFFALWYEAEKIKKALSTSPEEYQETEPPSVAAANGVNLVSLIGDLNLEILDHELNIEVKYSEMKRCIEKDIRDTFDRAKNLCMGKNSATGKPKIKHYIDQIILAGNSSNLRLIREVMPHKVLGKPTDEFPALFQLDNYNLTFDRKDAKLAVARGALLTRFFKKYTSMDFPNSPNVRHQLRKGKPILKFDIDNIRNYVPFTITYVTGVASDILFKAGEKMNLKNRDDRGKLARKRIIAQETVECYRNENITQLARGEYYCQFNLAEAVAKHNGKDEVKDEEDVYELMNNYCLFYMELDDNRTLSCYMYTDIEKQSQPPLDENKAIATLCQKDESDNLVWKSGAILKYSASNLDESVDVIKLPIRRERMSMRETFSFRSSDDTLLWQLDFPDYKPKPVYEEEAFINISLKLENDIPVLEYTVYDPDFENVHQIHPSYNDMKRKLPFNPFKGDE